jgi:hypothetical protein
MPYAIRKLPQLHHNRHAPLKYEVINTETGHVFAKHTSHENAIRQLRLLHFKTHH